MVNITVKRLTVSDCIVLKLGDIYDFMVVCRDGESLWRGACRGSLQECIEMGIKVFE